jgi:O-antigen/teichoic acid export membrane protein
LLEGRRSLQTDTLAASVVLLLAATVVQRAIGFGRGVLFCRWMSPAALGEWEMAYNFLLLAAPLAVLGVPGSFGRYAEQFRQRGHLRTFLVRTAAWTIGCTAAAVALMHVFSAPLSSAVFGHDRYANLMQNIALCLATIVLHHTLTAVLTALRLARVVTAMNFAQSLLFAVLSLALVWRHPDMTSIVYAYAVACLAASLGALAWSWPAFREIDRPAETLPHSQFWNKLLRFAFFVWVTNVLTHLFAVVDRYMLVHCAGMSPEEALEQIGYYHTSRIVPLLLVSISDLLAGLVMPHLSHDWEQGNRARVSQRLNMAVKLTSCGMIACGACVLVAEPLLFDVVLQGRYNAGRAVLPWALAGCVWYSVYVVAQCYLWCAEKTRWTVAPLVLALGANIVLNLFLLPAYGLYGAVLSTGAATCLCLLSALEISRWHGMHVDRGTWLLSLAPVALGLGLWPTIVASLAITALAVRGNSIFTIVERRDLTEFVLTGMHRVAPLWRAVASRRARKAWPSG